jgi:uncharacterized protein HemX
MGMPVSQVRRADEGQDSPSPWERAWRRIRKAARDLVSLRRVEPATARLVTQEEEALLRQHLELLLFAARVAAMQPDGVAYAQSLRSAGHWLEQYFDVAKPQVEAALAELAALELTIIEPPLPKIGDAGRMLHAVILGGSPPP